MELTGLEGKVAVVTGASRGIGKSIARVLARSRVRVVCCARNQELLSETCSEIEKDGGVALSVTADVTSSSDRERLIEQALSHFGAIDILVNNAGIILEKDSLELSDREIMQVMEVNFFAMFSLSRDIAKHMIVRGGGKIINMGSFWGQLGIAKHVAYCSSKSAIEAMTRCLAVEWARHNIQVNAVAPGHIVTDISKEARENEKIRNEIFRRTPARRFGDPEEVAYLTAFLCSQEANYMTGHVYYIDGGQLISG